MSNISPNTISINLTKGTFIDVFAGCGGLSLGLINAGWAGLFAIEKDDFAFQTLSNNLINKPDSSFVWPEWLPQTTHCVASLIDTYTDNLKAMGGQVDLLAGGPPCQGFSSAGRRVSNDPRNSLMQSYLKLVEIVKPKSVLIENVHGITVDFSDSSTDSGKLNYSKILIDALSIEYDVFFRTINVSDFGVPQARNRFFLLAMRKDLRNEKSENPFPLLYEGKNTFLKNKGLLSPVSAHTAISDLEIHRNGRVVCNDSPNFEAIGYVGPQSSYQKLMREGSVEAPSNTRLAKHKPHIVTRFTEIIRLCQIEGRLNRSISAQMRELFGLRKLALRVLDPDAPSPTITSMPDDLLHYREPRTLTVRENARLQSFPDWYEFYGKYTTGGVLRKKEVPRFTQVANAVPPLMAEAIGHTLKTWLRINRT